jgi:general secretion pathway protein D
MKRVRSSCFAALALLLGGCASTVVDEADRQARAGEFEAAYATLEAAVRRHPDDAALRTAQARARDRLVVRALATAELALSGGHAEEAQRLIERVRRLDPQQPRLALLEADLERARRRQRRGDAAAAPSPAPSLAATAEAGSALGPAFRKPVTLEFREAPLRQVFEALARTSGVNFVFDKDVRGDAKVTVFLRGVTLEEALRVILATQQLDRKLLNDSTLMVYPNTVPKQREHQELVTRVLYLVNADVKQVLPLVRTMAKTRDLHADERLNALVLRDTPEVVRLVEKLVATVDLADPEVMMAVEVLEVGSDRLDELGLAWPGEIQFGIPGLSGQVPLGNGSGFRGSVANPALAATLRGTAGTTNLLANPTIRARNHEKAKVQIGEKLPVFSTTSATVNVGASTTVTYLDVGLKLEVEPSVQLDGEVIIKVGLEVSNLLSEVAGPSGSLAYRVGTRVTTTSLRLRDGQTQVLSGLINDEDRKSAVGLPGLSGLPLLGRLFGVHKDTRNKTEIVMLITPRIVRNLELPDAAGATLPSGTETLPGLAPLRLQRQAAVGLAPGRTAGAAAAAAKGGAAEDGGAAATAGAATLLLGATPEAAVGDTVSVTLVNGSGLALRGELEFDATRLQSTSGAGAQGNLPFTTPPHTDLVVVLRVRPEAAGSSVSVGVAGLAATGPDGEAAEVRVEGEAVIRVAPVAGAGAGAGAPPP